MKELCKNNLGCFCRCREDEFYKKNQDMFLEM